LWGAWLARVGLGAIVGGGARIRMWGFWKGMWVAQG